MAANIDTMTYFGETPWHGLGETLTEQDTQDVEKVREKSGVIWNVNEKAVYTVDENVQAQVPGFKVLQRSDTGSTLSVVSDDYRVVQPETVFEFYKNFVDNHGFKMHTAGSLAGGKKIWALAEVGKEFALKGNDTVGAYLLLATSYDRSMATIAKFTSVRVVCQNTLNVSIDDGNRAIKVSHSAEFDKGQITLDVEALARGFDKFHMESKAMSERIVSRDEVVKFFLDLYYPKVKDANEIGTRQRNTMDNLVNIFHKGKGQIEAGQTAWGLLNAVTLHVDHEKGRNRDSALNSAWFGAGEKLKDDAFKAALKLVA